ncbi:class I adenylate-forming enzyme family protein [Frankia sp. AgB32]|uniref:class I adenylate-forming enzyme family protein n=1 Tax=Frankia sp. AgB32 TaxID=631119 RepID=UPI00200E60E0|nr:AMP-binding protein [Frankia sp. AgB32]MCK9896364.1 AMP-binding protein [Frankia sp. AgB32]
MVVDHPAVVLEQASPHLSDQTVGGLLRDTAAACPDALALEAVPDGTREPRTWTYSELLTEAEQIAGGIARRVPAGGRVALWAPNVQHWPIFEYAAALAGVVLVALNPTLRAGELHHALSLSEATMLMHADKVRGYDMAAAVRDVVVGLPSLEHVASLTDWEDLREPGGVPASRVAATASEDAAQIQFTSGTTGPPKAVLLSHRAVVNVARFTFLELGLADRTTVVSPLPMFHTAGCVISCLGPATLGGTFVLLERFEPVLLLDVLRRRPGSVLSSVPAVLTMLADVAGKQQTPPPRLGCVLTGAAPVRSRLIAGIEKLFATTVVNLYGQTELASVVTLTRPGDSLETRSTTVGRPLPRVSCRIVRPGTSTVLPFGATGEICVRGYQQMLGYHADPAATARKVDAEGWLHTGDLGSLGPDGTLRLEGRVDDLIICGGENIAPEEIERLLAGLPDVREALVLGVPDDVRGEVVVAVVCPASDRAVDVVAAHALCREKFAPFKIPVRWYEAKSWPMTPAGKIQRFRLKELIAQGGLVRLDPEGAST